MIMPLYNRENLVLISTKFPLYHCENWHYSSILFHSYLLRPRSTKVFLMVSINTGVKGSLLPISEIIRAQGDQEVICYQNTACFSNDFIPSAMSNQSDCCRHGVAPYGMAFRFLGSESCNPCPIGES